MLIKHTEDCRKTWPRHTRSACRLVHEERGKFIEEHRLYEERQLRERRRAPALVRGRPGQSQGRQNARNGRRHLPSWAAVRAHVAGLYRRRTPLSAATHIMDAKSREEALLLGPTLHGAASEALARQLLHPRAPGWRKQSFIVREGLLDFHRSRSRRRRCRSSTRASPKGVRRGPQRRAAGRSFP